MSFRRGRVLPPSKWKVRYSLFAPWQPGHSTCPWPGRLDAPAGSLDLVTQTEKQEGVGFILVVLIVASTIQWQKPWDPNCFWVRIDCVGAAWLPLVPAQSFYKLVLQTFWWSPRLLARPPEMSFLGELELLFVYAWRILSGYLVLSIVIQVRKVLNIYC